MYENTVYDLIIEMYKGHTLLSKKILNNVKIYFLNYTVTKL